MAIMRMRSFLVICALLIIAGCTVPSQFYLRNDLSRPVKLRLYKPDAGKVSNPLALIREVVQVRYNINKRFTETITPLRVEADFIDYELPPMSTIYIGSGANSKKFNFSDAYLLSDDLVEKTPLFVVGDEKIIAKKGLTKGYYVYYDLSEVLTE